MADGTTVSEVQVNAPPKKPAPDPLAAAEQQEAGNLKTLDAQLQSIGERTSQAESAIESKVEGLHPPTLETVPPPQVKETDPQKVWSSAAMWLAAIGSLFTRQPLTTAMNAAAGVITAFREGDQNRANAAFQTWKIANENAIKLADFQERTYRDILGDAERQERLISEQGSRDERIAIAEMQANATAFRDDIMIAALNQRGVQGAAELQLRRDEWRQRMQDSTAENIEHFDAISAIRALHESPEWKAADPITRHRMDMSVLHDTSPKAAAQARAQIKEQRTQLLARNDADRKRVMDHMSAYKSAHAGVVPPDDPVWQNDSRALQTIDANRARIVAAFDKAESGGTAGGSAHSGYASASDVAAAVKSGAISYDEGVDILRRNGWAQ